MKRWISALAALWLLGAEIPLARGSAVLEILPETAAPAGSSGAEILTLETDASRTGEADTEAPAAAHSGAGILTVGTDSSVPGEKAPEDTATVPPPVPETARQDLSSLEIAPEATTLDLDRMGIRVTDREALAAVLDEAPQIRRVFLFDSQLSTADMEWLFDRYYPRVFLGFTLHIGPHVIRTDQTAFSTLHYSSPTKDDPRHTSEELYPLRMCVHLQALDLGHNYLTDLSFLHWMPELEVLIISPNYGLTDISPVAECKNLVYLECFNTPITDLSPLAGLTKLRDLNLTRDGQVTDLSPLYDLPNLERFWWGHMDRVPIEQKKIMREKHKGCKFVMVYDPTDGGWRRHPHFNALHSFFRTGVYVPFAD